MNLNTWALRGLSMSIVLLAQALMFFGAYHTMWQTILYLLP